MASVKEIYSELDLRIPASLSAPWDNDGLIVCPNAGAEVRRVLLSLDATAAVCAEGRGYDVIVTHHPIIFKKLGALTSENAVSAKILSLIDGGVAVMSFHTRFDACDGGINDILSGKFGISSIEKYGDEETPTLGRIGRVAPISAAELCEKAKKILGSPRILCADAGKTVSRLAVCGGGGKSLVFPALAAGADAIILGECDYNTALDARDAGITVIAAGHYFTEAIFAEYFEKFFKKHYPNIDVERSSVGCEIKII